MTTPDIPTIRRQLALLADFLRTEATRPKADRTLLDAAGQEVAVLREQLRGKTLITLPHPDDTNPDLWFRDAGTIEIDRNSCDPEAVWFRDGAMGPEDAREVGLALLAAAALANCPEPASEIAGDRPQAAP